jgi:hypothetical protein
VLHINRPSGNNKSRGPSLWFSSPKQSRPSSQMFRPRTQSVPRTPRHPWHRRGSGRFSVAPRPQLSILGPCDQVSDRPTRAQHVTHKSDLNKKLSLIRPGAPVHPILRYIQSCTFTPAADSLEPRVHPALYVFLLSPERSVDGRPCSQFGEKSPMYDANHPSESLLAGVPKKPHII